MTGKTFATSKCAEISTIVILLDGRARESAPPRRDAATFGKRFLQTLLLSARLLAALRRESSLDTLVRYLAVGRSSPGGSEIPSV